MKLAFVFLVVFVATSYQQRLQYNRMFWAPNIDDADEYNQFDRSFHPRKFGGDQNYFLNPQAHQDEPVVNITKCINFFTTQTKSNQIH